MKGRIDYQGLFITGFVSGVYRGEVCPDCRNKGRWLIYDTSLGIKGTPLMELEDNEKVFIFSSVEKAMAAIKELPALFRIEPIRDRYVIRNLSHHRIGSAVMHGWGRWKVNMPKDYSPSIGIRNNHESALSVVDYRSIIDILSDLECSP